jgi:hypothetical protein
MSEYRPDNWVVIKVMESKIGHPHYKVLGGWSGGYLDGDSWRMNSGVVDVEKKDDYYLFYGRSGSVYQCHKDAYGLRMNNAGVWNHISSNQPFEGHVTLMDENTDWLTLV